MAKSKRSAASATSTSSQKTKQAQYQQQYQPLPQQQIITNDETLLIDPAIVAAENPDVSRLFICSFCSTVEALLALLATHTLL